jgi:hypothetical protein
MVKRALILAVAAAFSLLGLAPAGASSPTILSMTLTEADGSPFANSPVSVFYWPASPSSSGSFSLRLMGSGTTGSSGTVSIPLDTSMVSDAGDVGDGIPDAFNAIVTGFDSSGHVIWQREVITENAAKAATASVLTDPATGAPVCGVRCPAPVLAHRVGYRRADRHPLPVRALAGREQQRRDEHPARLHLQQLHRPANRDRCRGVGERCELGRGRRRKAPGWIISRGR